MIADSQSDRPSVLFVTRKWPPAVGGMETYAVELTRELAHHVNLDVVALPGKADGSPPSVLSLIGFAIKALRHYWRRDIPPDVLHVCDIASWPLALVVWTRSKKPTLVLSAHGTDVGYHRRGGFKGVLYGAYLGLGARLLGSARIIANSAATANAAAETGWRTSEIVPLATTMPESDLNLSGHGKHLLFVGRLIERKGCRWFIENVLPLLSTEIELKVAGTLWDKDEAPAISSERVTFLGPLHGEELTVAYRSALCVIVPNIEPASGEFEGFGLVAAEAAAAGGIVLAANCGGIPEAVIEGETGYLVPTGDADAWSAQIAEITGWEDELRAEFIARATTRARAHFSWARVTYEVLRVYAVG